MKLSQKLILIIIAIPFLFCRTLNDSQENEDKKKCRIGVLYNISMSQQISGEIQKIPILWNYNQCLKIAKEKRGNLEIPL